MKSEIKIIENTSLSDLTSSEGFQYGIGVFETMRRLPTGIEDFEAHMMRLRDSALALNIPLPEEFSDYRRLKNHIETQCLNKAEAHGDPNEVTVIKLTLFKQGSESRWMVSERPFVYKKSHFDQGFRLKVSGVRRNSTSLFQRHKTLNYGENWLEKQKVIENGYQEVLFLNENDLLTETSASNLFFYKEGRWHTPELSCGLLKGVMRQRVIDQLSLNGKSVNQGRYTLKDLWAADYVFITNALMGLMPVKTVDSHEFELVDDPKIINYYAIDPARSMFE